VLGDDLALNAQQVSGVQANRELPVVWAVAKGSFLNKLILVPLALAISATLPWLVTVLLMLGGLYLCYEGVEKLAHSWLHSKDKAEAHHQELAQAVSDPEVDIKAFEKKKIKGAIRTDFILSAEIIVIALGVAQAGDFKTQVIVVSLIAVAMTVGVYGLVAAIVKFDDAGLALLDNSGANGFERFKQALGRGILFIAPKFMHLLSMLGMIAMFLVGGGILVHGLPFLHHLMEPLVHGLGTTLSLILPTLFNAIVGMIAGAVALGSVSAVKRLVS
jgi:predicted DNA repair protein MutK